MEKKGRGYQGTRIKDRWTKPKGGRIEGGDGLGGENGRGMKTTVLEQQLKRKRKRKS